MVDMVHKQQQDSACGMAFEAMPEEHAVLLAQQGNRDALTYVLAKYKRLVLLKARSFFLIGADHEDLVQEGMIGLYEAIRDFDPDRQASFYTFAEMCIKRQIISAIKAATRQKHRPLNSYVSFHKPLYDDPEKTLLDTIEDRAGDPEEMLIVHEDLMNFEAHMRKVLSPFEQDVLNLFVEGSSYAEISARLGKHQKAVDNALQRIKKKTNRYLREIKNQPIDG